jgi:hypothetical protein
MKKSLLGLAFIILLAAEVVAQNYSVALIPDSLKANAHCVVREFTKETEVASIIQLLRE